MQFNKLAKRIVYITGILAVVLLLLFFCAYLIFGRKSKEKSEEAGATDFTTVALVPFSEDDPMLTTDVMKDYDFTVMEIWYPGNADCVRYMTEMNMFAEECLHRDDEMYTFVTGVCLNLNDLNGNVVEERLNAAKEVCERENVNYHQYIADPSTSKILRNLQVREYPTVIFLNREGKIVDIVQGMNGKELCVYLDTLVDEYMKEKRKMEREEEK